MHSLSAGQVYSSFLLNDSQLNTLLLSCLAELEDFETKFQAATEPQRMPLCLTLSSKLHSLWNSALSREIAGTWLEEVKGASAQLESVVQAEGVNAVAKAVTWEGISAGIEFLRHFPSECIVGKLAEAQRILSRRETLGTLKEEDLPG